jgi:hypothetical protein
MQRNDCYTKPGQVNLVCAALGKPTTPYIASVPVQIEFRMENRLDGRVVPFLFSPTYSIGAVNAQEAERLAIDAAIREGALQALVSAGVLVARAASTKKNAPMIYEVAGGMKQAIAANAQSAAATQAADAFSGRWSGSYQCGQRAIALTMDLAVDASRHAQGVFKFCNGGDRSSGVRDGKWQFGLAGQLVDGDTLRLEPLPARSDPARVMPPGYNTVGVVLEATSATTLSGQIQHNQCTLVQLRRHRGSESGICD